VANNRKSKRAWDGKFAQTGAGTANEHSFPGTRRLDEVVKLPLLRLESAEDVRKIWETQHTHETEGAVGAVYSKAEFEAYKHRSIRHSMFVLPVRREQGFMTMLMQFQGNACLFTYLEDYQKNPQTAMPWLAIHLFDDIMATHGLCLARGEFSKPHLTKPEAKRLLALMHRFYVHDDFYQKVVEFNDAPDRFDFTRHLQEAADMYFDADPEAGKPPTA
jgi:GNAT superfamily N-acetyltransferase